MEQRWKVLIVTSIGLFMASLDSSSSTSPSPTSRAGFPGTSTCRASPGCQRLRDRVRRPSWSPPAPSPTGSAASASSSRRDRVRRSPRRGRGRADVAVLVAARALQAVGAAMVIPTTLGLLLPAFPPAPTGLRDRRPRRVGGVAAALGPPIGGILVQVAGAGSSSRTSRSPARRIRRLRILAQGAPPRPAAGPTCSAPPLWRWGSPPRSRSASPRARNGAGPARARSRSFLGAIALVAASSTAPPTTPRR